MAGKVAFMTCFVGLGITIINYIVFRSILSDCGSPPDFNVSS